jgi:hypothetical protein
VLSSTSRFGFVSSSVNSLVASGSVPSCVNGLSHGLSSVAIQFEPATAMAVMIRVLFFAGPRVIRIVKLTSCSGWSACGFRPLSSKPSTSGTEPGCRNRTSYTLPFCETVMSALGSTAVTSGRRASETATAGALKSIAPVEAPL